MAKRRIRVAEFRGEDVELEMPDGTVYPIRGDLPTEVVSFMTSIEEESGSGRETIAELEAMKSDDLATLARERGIEGRSKMTAEALRVALAEQAQEESDSLDWLDRGQALLLDLIREKTPDATMPLLSPQELLGTLGSIVGGETVGQALTKALSDGLDVEAINEAAALSEDGETGEDGVPLATEETTGSRSENSSSEPASDSRPATTGRPTGGNPAPGPASKSTSASRTKRRAA